jgi:hypothetical protein
MPTGPYYVYILFRPNGVPCYVGKGKDNRWFKHEKRANRIHNRHLNAIVEMALTNGEELPKIKIREGLSETEAFLLERIFIAAIGRELHGGPLVNLTDGGEGQSGRVCSDETKQKIGDRHRGRSHSDEWKAAISAGLSSEETKLSISATQKKRFEDPAERARAGAKNVGRKRSAETAEKQRLNNPGNTGHKHTEEALRKIREARARQTIRDRERKRLAAESTNLL